MVQLRRALDKLSRHPGALFVLIGLVAAAIVSIGDSDRMVQLRFTLTLGAFYLAGGLVEQLAGVRGDAPLAPVHRIVLGQLALVFYFYLRSPLAHLGVLNLLDDVGTQLVSRTPPLTPGPRDFPGEMRTFTLDR